MLYNVEFNDAQHASCASAISVTVGGNGGGAGGMLSIIEFNVVP
jgi:hypothetical protein